MNRAEQASLIKLKLVKLLQLQTTLQTELEQAKAENQKLQQLLDETRKSEEIAQERNKISKLADGIHLEGQDTAEVKKYLNGYIRQIDECLKLLNQLSDNT